MNILTLEELTKKMRLSYSMDYGILCTRRVTILVTKVGRMQDTADRTSGECIMHHSSETHRLDRKKYGTLQHIRLE
jgi:hypothetical protein